MATSSQGLTFVFSGTTLTITSVQVNDNQDLLDATHLGVAPNGRRIFVGGLATDREVTIDYVSTTILSAGGAGELEISGPISISGIATVASASIGASVGDFVRGSATFRLT